MDLPRFATRSDRDLAIRFGLSLAAVVLMLASALTGSGWWAWLVVVVILPGTVLQGAALVRRRMTLPGR